ncbi:MAG: hypothetical protein ACLRWF_07795 [Ruthenibacterium sp.]
MIESYDISNWGDGTSVAGMVVFEDGKPKKAGYRRFKMHTVPGTDDYASMAETLARRAAEYEKGTNSQFKIKPDLLLIDGGRGQVAAVCAALAGTRLAGVPVFGMVKDSKHRTRGLWMRRARNCSAMHRGPSPSSLPFRTRRTAGPTITAAGCKGQGLFLHAGGCAGVGRPRPRPCWPTSKRWGCARYRWTSCAPGRFKARGPGRVERLHASP